MGPINPVMFVCLQRQDSYGMGGNVTRLFDAGLKIIKELGIINQRNGGIRRKDIREATLPGRLRSRYC